MDLPQVDTCCFGLVPLKTGSIIVGIATVVIEIMFHGYASYSSQDLLRALYSILVVCGVISAFLLIWGVLSDNKMLAKLYLICYGLLVIFTIILLILVLLRSHGSPTDYIINTIIYLCVIAYCLIVVNSYYKTMA